MGKPGTRYVTPRTGETISPPTAVYACHRDSVLASGNTPATRPLRGLPPPPFTGAGSEWRLPRWPCTELEWNFPNGFAKTPERCHPRTVYRWGIVVTGGRADREGDGTSPLSPACPGNCLPLNTPATRLLSRTHRPLLKNLSRLKHCTSVNTQPRKMFVIYFSPRAKASFRAKTSLRNKEMRRKGRLRCGW